MPVVPGKDFHIEKKGKRLFLYPKDKLGELGVYFVIEDLKDGKVLIHDDGSVVENLSNYIDPALLVKELRGGARSLGYIFRNGRVFVKCNRSDAVMFAKKLERLIAEIAERIEWHREVDNGVEGSY